MDAEKIKFSNIPHRALDVGANIHTFVSYIRMNPSPVFPSQDSQLVTRVALLDAAERLFSQNGIEGTSVREIIKAAGANLGAINYHFGTKDRLALEVFARRIEPVNRERMARLDALEAAAGRRKLKLEQILDALIRPVLESEGLDLKNCDDFMRLISRSFQEPNPEVKKFVEEKFAEVVQPVRFGDPAGGAGIAAGRSLLAHVLPARRAASRAADVAAVRPDARTPCSTRQRRSRIARG